MTGTFFGEFDLAASTLWLFWAFFAGLLFYIQRENMREGYPLEDDEGNKSSNPGMFPLPDDKTFELPHGRGSVTVPSDQTPERADLPLKRVGPGNGYPLEPTGDPMLEGLALHPGPRAAMRPSWTGTAIPKSCRCPQMMRSSLPRAGIRADCRSFQVTARLLAK